MRWNVAPRRRKPNSRRWKADRTEYARCQLWAFDLPSLSITRPV
ncbi:hypothetical protein ACFU96_21430 [Streptomyces sp. NPDC057620]